MGWKHQISKGKELNSYDMTQFGTSGRKIEWTQKDDKQSWRIYPRAKGISQKNKS